MRTPYDAPTDWRFVASGRHVTPMGEEAFCFVFQDGRLVVNTGPGGRVPRVSSFDQSGVVFDHKHFLGLCQGIACFCGELAAGLPLPPDHVTVDLRRFVMEVQDEDLFAMAARALQIIQWDHTHAYCSRCGSPTQDHAKDFAKVCPACDYTQYPRISPCIIVLVTRGDQVLLARGASFSLPMYSTLAGFVEPGETLEQAVHREVWEETGVIIKNLQYRGSQPWPFPHSLMIGFWAEYAGGDISPDPHEIADAGWYHPSQLPPIPPRGSISRRLIDEYLQTVLNIAPRGW